MKVQRIVLLVILAGCGKAGSLETMLLTESRQPASNSLGETDVGSPEEQSVGFYSQGSLRNASQFVLENNSVLKISRPLHRGYASQDMTDVVGYAATFVKSRFPKGERLQIGDVTAKKGGQLALHLSHQNGLDADVSYYRLNHREQNPNQMIGFDEIFVKAGRISPNFDAVRNWEFVKALYSTGRLRRIFVDPVIKQALCLRALALNEVNQYAEALRRLDPYPSHQDHMHVRIECPRLSPRCTPQALPPPGHGCGVAMIKSMIPEFVELEDGC